MDITVLDHDDADGLTIPLPNQPSAGCETGSRTRHWLNSLASNRSVEFSGNGSRERA
jgi:hypothetical protein